MIYFELNYHNTLFLRRYSIIEIFNVYGWRWRWHQATKKRDKVNAYSYTSIIVDEFVKRTPYSISRFDDSKFYENFITRFQKHAPLFCCLTRAATKQSQTLSFVLFAVQVYLKIALEILKKRIRIFGVVAPESILNSDSVGDSKSFKSFWLASSFNELAYTGAYRAAEGLFVSVFEQIIIINLSNLVIGSSDVTFAILMVRT